MLAINEIIHYEGLFLAFEGWFTGNVIATIPIVPFLLRYVTPYISSKQNPMWKATGNKIFVLDISPTGILLTSFYSTLTKEQCTHITAYCNNLNFDNEKSYSPSTTFRYSNSQAYKHAASLLSFRSFTVPFSPSFEHSS